MWAPGCPESDRSDSLTDIALSESEDLEGWSTVEVAFSGFLPDGGCAGDWVAIVLPSELNHPGGTWDVVTPAPESAVIGTMTVTKTGGVATARFEFNEYIETHDSVSYRGGLTSSLKGEIAPETDGYELEWQVQDRVIRTPVSTGPCPDCDTRPERVNKWVGFETDGDGNHLLDDEGLETLAWGIESRLTQQAGEYISFTDWVPEGQEFICDSVHVMTGTDLTPWGSIDFDTWYPAQWWFDGSITVESYFWCDDDGGSDYIRVDVLAPEAGMYVMIGGRTRVLDADQGEYWDYGRVAQRGEGPEDVNRAAYRSSGWAGGDGRTPGTPETPETPEGPTPPDRVETGASGASTAGIGIAALVIAAGSGLILTARRMTRE